MKHFTAFPLLLMPLDVQIKRRGGEGFNCDVKATPIPGSYSVKYEFETAFGPATLTTLNQFNLGIIHSNEGPLHVMYCADKQSFFKVLVKPAKRLIGKKILFTTPIAETFEQAMSVLKSWYPTYTNWKLDKPPII
ncbi:MAG: hypothetical protein CML21_00570 [Rheinheimera sp.]|nr:hypothetical protein [Rheinheimera sp.]|tara:strand:+ start:2111 stop:2515 length:405 start_codon:yes stop_codon:yes gene_type:complete